ncbi:MAG TPA: nucleotide exchange factor GrpE, partial [Verrucomicrobiales bacterium]|nr:nucleotide exchange factor GrpE [Verrucomicrobiales bacterium]
EAPDASGAPTPPELAALQAKAAKADEHWNALLRTTADFDNFKKRAARERQEALKYATEGLLEKIIPVLDNLEMAMAAAQSGPAAGADSIRAGVQMIQQQLKGVLADAGLSEIQAQGQPFDPNIHEAVSQQESADLPEGHVVQQLRKGYRLRDRLLRPATVIVSKAPSATV